MWGSLLIGLLSCTVVTSPAPPLSLFPGPVLKLKQALNYPTGFDIQIDEVIATGEKVHILACFSITSCK